MCNCTYPCDTVKAYFAHLDWLAPVPERGQVRQSAQICSNCKFVENCGVPGCRQRPWHEWSSQWWGSS